MTQRQPPAARNMPPPRGHPSLREPLKIALNPVELREMRHVTIHPSFLDRLAEWLVSERAFYFGLGVYAGCLMTVGLAALWAGVL